MYDYVFIGLIGLLYNMFFHRLAELVYSNESFSDKYKKTISILFVFGILGIVVGQIILPRHSKYNNSRVANGITVGGALVLASVVINNWNYMGELSKLLAVGFILSAIVYHSYNKDEVVDHKRIKKVV